VQQAARQFEIWTGKPAPWDEMLRVVTKILEEPSAAKNGGNDTKKK
jgi:3-dehydroquinate dehydratase/shikimate dehydrogenase